MISVLMCTYNRRACLRKAIDSVLCQTYKDFEFIIIDDGSTDETDKLIEEYSDHRIKYFKLERNSFYCYAANEGLSHCGGEYVAFMNSDDEWLPEKLEKQVAFMEKEKTFGACFTRVSLVDADGNDISEECEDMAEVFERKFTSQKECLRLLMKTGNFLCHPSAMVRKSVLDQVGSFNLLYRQLADYDLWLRIVSKTPIYILEEHLIRFLWDIKGRKQISTATRENIIRSFNESVMIRKNCIEVLTDEKFREFFNEDFRNVQSKTSLELEFEKAFLLMHCMSEAPELKVAGMEKLEKVMRKPGAMQVLREHFNLDIFDLYQWNKEEMYQTSQMQNEYAAKEQQLIYYMDIVQQKETYIMQQKEQMEKQNTAIEQQQKYIQVQKQELEKCREKESQKEVELQIKDEKIREQEELINTYANSTSWKITEPMRRIMRLLKKGK